MPSYSCRASLFAENGDDERHLRVVTVRCVGDWRVVVARQDGSARDPDQSAAN